MSFYGMHRFRNTSQHTISNKDIRKVALSVGSYFECVACAYERRILNKYISRRKRACTFYTHSIILGINYTISDYYIGASIWVKTIIIIIGLILNPNAVKDKIFTCQIILHP